jgi:hypothetical protein
VDRYAAELGSARPTLSLLGHKIVRFFPFHQDEIPEIMVALGDLIGRAPDTEAEFAAHVAGAQDMQWRTQTHQELTVDQEWLITVQQLQDLIRRVMDTPKTLDDHDLELLFHSCRLNEEVSMEALLLLKKTWYTLTSESTRLRLLQIVARLVDPRVLPPHLPHVRELLNWLTTVERQLDPYKSPGSLRAIIALRKVAEQLRSTSVLNQLETRALMDGFELLQEYDRFQDRSVIDQPVTESVVVNTHLSEPRAGRSILS